QAVEQAGRGRHFINVLAVVPQRQVQFRLGEGQARELFADVAHLGAGGTQEFGAYGCVVKQVPNLDASAGRHVSRPHGGQLAAVVHDADQVGAALLDLDINAARTGIDAVFEQLLDDAGRSFDDLARGDLRNYGFRKLLDARHSSVDGGQWMVDGKKPVFSPST